MGGVIKNEHLIESIKELIEQTKQHVAITINSTLTMMYWSIGKKINDEILQNKRADYGKEIVSTVSRQLQEQYGDGYSLKNLRHMMKFNEVLSNVEKVSTLSRQLTWSHFKELIYFDDNLKRDFYIQMALADNWSVRTLRDRINSLLYERTALSKKPDELIQLELENLKAGKPSKDVLLKSPYILDFLDLKDRYLEKDLEDAILRDIEHFILELGSGFSFVARQKVIQIDNEDFKIDLLFYNRKLKRLIAIELKIGKFKASYKGQMELYLRWLDTYEKQEGEESPLGIILCTGKQEEQIELLELEKSGIHVAEYLTVLPPKKQLEAKLHEAVQLARERYHVED
jgi:predicted nuclease of restriction endonuclease-like (RecB) superfamily